MNSTIPAADFTLAAVLMEAELAALRAKAAAFDVLSAAVAREDGGDWEIYHGIENPVVIYMRATGRVISAATLADAVRLAMEAVYSGAARTSVTAQIGHARNAGINGIAGRIILPQRWGLRGPSARDAKQHGTMGELDAPPSPDK